MKRRRHDKPYACVDVDLPRNARVMDLKEPAACLGLWLAMLCYAREELTDGFVPKRYAGSLFGDRKNEERLADMVRVGLLADRGERWEVLRYAPRNQTKAMVEKDREDARERMRVVRANRGRTNEELGSNESPNYPEQTGEVPTSTSLSDCDLGEGVRGVRPSAPTSSTVKLTSDGAMGMSADCWMDGVRSVTGQPFVGMTLGHRGTLVEALKARCPSGTEITEWARAQGAAFAKAYTGKKLSVLTYTDWLNTTESKPPNPYDGEAVRQERARREQEQREAERSAAPMPEALKAMARGRPTPPSQPPKTGAA